MYVRKLLALQPFRHPNQQEFDRLQVSLEVQNSHQELSTPTIHHPYQQECWFALASGSRYRQQYAQQPHRHQQQSACHYHQQHQKAR